MRTAIITVSVLVLGILLVLSLLAFVLLRYVVKPKNETLEYTMERERVRGFLGNYEKYNKQELNIPSKQGYLLHGILLKNAKDKFVIISHGYTANHLASIKYANIFYELGYSVYIYDLRNHGRNDKTYCSMGKWESADIVTIANYLRQRFGENISIGLHGESLGAASSILALGEDTRFSFCVADCGFADLGMLLEELSGQMVHLPAKLSHLASYACQLKYGYRLDRIRPVDAFRKNQKTPILLIHGKLDDFILPKHCNMFYEEAKNQKEIYYFEHAKHASSYASNPEKYAKTVQEFVKKWTSQN